MLLRESTPSAQAWARARTQEAGLPRPRDVHAISSVRDTGVRDLLAALHRAAGGRGDVWVVSHLHRSLACTHPHRAPQP